MRPILSCFSHRKPIIGMVHTKGTSNDDMMERAKREIDIYIKGDVDGVLVEPYFGTYHQVVRVLEYLKTAGIPMPYGVNCLNVDAMGFELANRYDCDFLQVDSVIGHVKPRDEETLQAFFDLYRSNCKAALMGGVRFKYQPIFSNCSVEEDLVTAMGRCDAVCVTESATGEETSLSKIRQFRATLKEFPLFICAGVTAENVAMQLRYADGAVVGSYFKDTYKDTGDVCMEHVKRLMDEVKAIRQMEETE